MYFWKIEKLKEELKENALNQKQVFLYILVYVLLYQVFAEMGYLFPSQDAGNTSRYIQPIIDVVGVGLGTYWCFSANGGSSGRQFAERYFSIGFVLGLRFLLVMLISIIAAGLLIGILVGLGTISEDGLVAKFLISAVMTLWLAAFYWRMAVHIQDVAKTDRINA